MEQVWKRPPSKASRPDFVMPIPTLVPSRADFLESMALYFQEIDDTDLVVEVSPIKGRTAYPVEIQRHAELSPIKRVEIQRHAELSPIKRVEIQRHAESLPLKSAVPVEAQQRLGQLSPRMQVQRLAESSPEQSAAKIQCREASEPPAMGSAYICSGKAQWLGENGLLTEELLEKVFRMTMSPREISRVGNCSRHWHSVSSSNVIWKSLYLERWGKQPSQSGSTSWKQAFVDLHEVEQVAKEEAERIEREHLLNQKAQNAYEELSNFYDEVDDEDLVFD